MAMYKLPRFGQEDEQQRIYLQKLLNVLAGTIPIAALLSANNLSDLASITTARANLGLGSAALVALDIDGTMAANSDARVPSQKAVVTYVAAHSGGSATPDFENTYCGGLM